MNTLTKQQIFDRVAKHLITQGQPAFDPVHEACQYRALGENGTTLKCAVGALIPDDVYTPEIEGVGTGALRVSWITSQQNAVAEKTLRTVLEKSGIDTTDQETIGLLTSLQGVHDDATIANPQNPVIYWRQRLAEMARRYDLSPAVLTEGSPT